MRHKSGPRLVIAGTCAVLACAAALVPPAAARAIFDGNWSVTATTAAGNCSSFRFPLAVIDGRVVSRDFTGVSGRVTPRGSVSVTVRQGDGMVVGTGRLRANSGAGRWTARSPSRRCMGQWQAQRGS